MLVHKGNVMEMCTCIILFNFFCQGAAGYEGPSILFQFILFGYEERGANIQVKYHVFNVYSM